MRKDAIGPSYRQLKPEVKETLDKIVYQLDLCRNTIGLLEQRITTNENKLANVMEFIKSDDLNYVSADESVLIEMLVQRPMIAKATVLMDNVEDPPNSGFKRENYALS